MKTVTKIAVSSATFFSLHQASVAAPNPVQSVKPTDTTSTRSTSPYKLALSLGPNWNTNYTGLPVVTVTLLNLSQHTLVFSSPPGSSVDFEVEYEPTQEKGALKTEWKILKPLNQPPTQPGKRRSFRGSSVVSQILPKQQGRLELVVGNISSSTEGIYRITAFEKFPDATEQDGPINTPTTSRRVSLELQSNSIIIRHVSGRFIAVPTVAGG